MKKYYTLILTLLLILGFSGCESMNQRSTIGKKTSINFKKCGKNIVITVTGKGAPPTEPKLSEVQKYLFAERAAVMDGYRLMAEKLQGVIINSASNSENFILKNDSIRTVTKTLLKGTKIVNILHKDNGVCEAELSIKIPECLIKNYLFPSVSSDTACLFR